MNKRELTNRINEIQIKNQHLKRLKGWLIYSLLVGGVFMFVAWWGFSNFQDPLLPNIASNTRSLIGWITIIFGVLSLIFSILVFIGIHNGKKHVLGLIDSLERDKHGKRN